MKVRDQKLWRPGVDAATRLREKAERALTARCLGELDPRDLSVEQIRNLIHELQVHQIELEMQNEELHGAQASLEEARDRFADLFEFAPVGYFVLDASWRITEVNLTAAGLLRIPRVDLIGQPLKYFVSEDSQDVFRQFLQKLQSGSRSVTEELRMLQGGMQSFIARLECNPECVPVGGLNAIRVAMSDVSEFRRTEKERSMFFAIASHELRTPVTNVTLALDMLCGDSGLAIPEQAQPLLEIARKGTHRLQRLVLEILDRQYLETGSMAYNRRPVSLKSVLEEAVAQCRPLAGQCGVVLRVENLIPEARVNADTDRLVQVLFNLIDNALRYSPKGESVQLGVMKVDDFVRVSVIDCGPGIPQEFREHVFEPFAQAAPALEGKPRRPNLGLGLSIAKTIVERLDGHIGFISEINGGTEFYFELPIVRTDP